METDPPSNPQDLTAFVQDLLEQMRAAASAGSIVTQYHDASSNRAPTRRQTRFESMSNQIVARIDEMGQRIDDLEQSIGELTDAAGIEPDADDYA